MICGTNARGFTPIVLVSISIEPVSKAYNVGDIPSATVIGLYSDGHIEELTDYETSVQTISKNTQSVIFSYEGFTAEQTVTQTTIWWYKDGIWANGPTAITKTAGSGAVTNNSTTVVLTDYGGMPNSAFFALNQQLPLSDVSTIYVKVRRSTTSDYSGQSFRFMVSKSSTAAGVQNGRAIGWTKPTSITTLALNVADFTDSKYLVFQDYNWNQTTTDTIYEIYGI